MSIRINLSTPEGNAIALIGLAKKLAHTIAMTNDETDAITKNMMSGDYEALLDTLVEAFPGFDFEFENDPRSQE